MERRYAVYTELQIDYEITTITISVDSSVAKNLDLTDNKSDGSDDENQSDHR